MADSTSNPDLHDANPNANTSTLSSLVEGAKGLVASGVSAVTGSAGQQSAADAHKAQAADTYEASHAVGKVGPFAVTGAGGVAQDDPDRADGQWQQTLGSAKETIGGLTGSAGLKQAGAEQRRAGEELEARGQLSDLGQGVADRAEGAVRSAVAGLTGDRAEREKWDAVHDRGKAAQRSVEKELGDKAPPPPPKD